MGLSGVGRRGHRSNPEKRIRVGGGSQKGRGLVLEKNLQRLGWVSHEKSE